jgi:glutathione S-transferase
MTREIGFGDIVREYVPIAQARRMSGMRLVLGAYAVPGPWREACKALFHVKGIPYASVRTSDEGASDLDLGMGGTQSELIAWTGQASAPVAIWNDERPRSSWIDQLNLAERLAPEPALIPADISSRMRMFGFINEIAGENGLAWSKRLLMTDGPLKSLPPGDPARPFWETLANKYGYDAAVAARATSRIVGILAALDAELAAHKARGNRFLMGERLSALDLYWATFCGLFKPMPPDRCPMATAYRAAYSNDDPDIERVLTPALLAHRDFIYEQYLELPIVF